MAKMRATFSRCPNRRLDDLKKRMITDAVRSTEILQRFKNNEPLNLSAIEVECPWLLEGLFEAKNFKGWRESIELAGVDIGAIRIEPLSSVTCQECGFEGDVLWSHLAFAHGMSAVDYRDAHPGVETSSESRRAEMMANRHGRPALTLLSHWEPAWSRNYALDRIHQFSRQGIALNYAHIAKNEPGFAAYIRRIFQSWDAGLAAAGIDVGKVRRAKEAANLSADQVVEGLLEKERVRPGQLHIRASRSGAGKTVITAACRHFGNYENALIAAGINPATKIPALKNKAKLRAREILLSETLENLKNKAQYKPLDANAYIVKHSQAIKDFYGSWPNFAISLKVVERDLFNSPGHLIYDSKAACIAGLQERARVGLSLRQNEVRIDNPSLEIMGEKHFGTHLQALMAAQVERLPHSYDQREYKNGDEVVAEIRRRYEKGETLYRADLDTKEGERTLLKWVGRYFGSYSDALVAAGVPHPGPKPRL